MTTVRTSTPGAFDRLIRDDPKVANEVVSMEGLILSATPASASAASKVLFVRNLLSPVLAFLLL